MHVYYAHNDNNISTFLNVFYFMCVHAVPTRLPVYHVHAVAAEQAEGTGSFGMINLFKLFLKVFWVCFVL